MFGLSLTRREWVFLGIALLTALLAAWALFSQSRESALPAEEAVAQKAAEDVAKSGNPFKADNPLKGVETNPFSEVKRVLNPFEQQ